MIARLCGGLMIVCIRIYQATLSPLLGGACRFEPSCSHYCIEAIRAHGPLRGLWLGVRRLCRCRPFGPWGYDPVPPAANGAWR
ncbi:MAG: membrane protein insertion efficiency factor YidD [Kiritimatiellae bacterium]|nr:membrane protein insertion efficiency factor YidD [Kiritimatiellia bacterium]